MDTGTYERAAEHVVSVTTDDPDLMSALRRALEPDICVLDPAGSLASSRVAVQDAGDLVLQVHRGDGACPRISYTYQRWAVTQLADHVRSLFHSPQQCAHALAPILGNSPAVELVRDQIRSVSRFADIPVLILGETGTGKELVARALHDCTFNASAPFIPINCAAIPADLLESELFGHEAGAFTGARTAKAGLLEAARGGTIFLDEVGDMPPALQPKLLRVLESREFRRVGSTTTRQLDCRILSATHCEPWSEDDASLRSDLVYRLAGFTIRLAPLRERGDDVELLARHFVRAFDQRYNPNLRQLSPNALQLLRAHDWPGNVRELRATLQHAAVVADSGVISSANIRSALSAHRVSGRVPTSQTPPPLDPPPHGLRALEKDVILRTLQANGGNVSSTARQLGIPRSTLRSKLERFTNH